MSLGTRRTLLVAGLLSVTLAAVLISRLSPLGNPPDRDEDRGTTLVGHTFPVQALAFGPEGATLTSAAYHFQSPRGAVEVAVWDSGTERRRAIRTEPLGELFALTFAPGVRTLACSGRDGTLRLWDTASRHERTLVGKGTSLVCALAFSADGSQLAAADPRNVTLWDVAAGRQKTCCHGPEARAFGLAFAPDARMVASGHEDSTILLWDAATGEGRGTLRGHASTVWALAFSPDGRILASGDTDSVVKLWNVAMATERATLETSRQKGTAVRFSDEVTALTFALDGRTLAVAIGRAVELWDVGTERRLACLEGHDGKVKCLAYSPDGTLLASGGYDQTVRLWDVARYRVRKP